MKNKAIVIVLGEPKSTFVEILLKVFNKKFLKKTSDKIIIIGSKKIFDNEIKKLNKFLTIKTFSEKFYNLKKNKILFLDIPFNQNKKKGNLAYLNGCFEKGLYLMKKFKFKAFINGPISKSNFLKGKYPGITEFIARKMKSKNEVMLIFNKQLSVSPLSTHIPIKDVTNKVKKKIIIKKILEINKFYKTYLKIRPRIAITGLNPHCETFRGINKEKREIIPAIKYLSKKKIRIFGPFSADTIFMKTNKKKYDVVFGMYHDQVLSPMKTLYGFDAINITLGLPFIRITPDHGPNFQMYGKNKSNPKSLIEAFKFINKYVK